MDWDNPISEQIHIRWEKWRRELFLLNDVTVRRSFKPDGFQQLNFVELHHFSDASVSGYGQCFYVRLVDENDEVHCSLAMEKSRVTPLKNVTIPRLELTAALVSVKVSTMLSQELDYDKVTHIYWTDSGVVLGYIGNDFRHFLVFVANRVQQNRNQKLRSAQRC